MTILPARAVSPFLLIAHPGHELRLFHWMERHKPHVFVLSDGSGGAAESRLSHSLATIRATGATIGDVFGPMSDRDWYAALLARDARPFQRVMEAILAAARRRRPGLLVSDALDGHNPLHDLCEAIGARVTRALVSEGLAPQLMTSPATASAIGALAEVWRLDERAAERKYAAVRAYAPLAEEAERLLAEEPDAIWTERLLTPSFDWPRDWLPDWEQFGRKRVSEGRYSQAITYAGHVRPLAREIVEHQAQPAACPAGTP